ncbi:MAG: AEC family transporter [Candidatus Cloacimonadota bacterium]|nr:AEC family transporter [Candidatus Cloacimonadota bacterium]
MTEQNIVLVFSFALGIVLKSLKFLSKDDAPVLLRFMLNVCLPPLMILAIYRATPSANMLLVPLIAMLVVFIIYFISSSIGKKLAMPRPTFGSFLVGTMIMNTAFALPYFKAIGSEELALASLYDIGNTILIFTFSYYNAIKYGDNAHSDRIQIKKFLTLLPLWAMAIAFAIKGFGLRIPPAAITLLEVLSQPIGVLMMVALGLAFAPKLSHLGKALIAVFIRMGLGFAAGFALSLLFGLQGVPRLVVLTCSALPVGFNTLIFADRENMDRSFAATMVSVSTLISLFTTPLLIRLFS